MNKMIRAVRSKRKLVGLFFAAGIVAGTVGLSGCTTQRIPAANTSSAGLTAPGKLGESYSRHHPGMVLYSDEMRALLAERDRKSGTATTDWVTQRNDYLLGLGSVAWDPYAYSEVIVTQDDYLYDSNGRPRSSSRQRVRTIRAGRQR